MAEDYSNVVLTKMLDLTALRHRVLANNLANVNTPTFRRQDLQFAEEFAEVAREGAQAVRDFQPVVAEDTKAPVRFDGNSVQLEQELSEMAKNAMLHQMALQLMSNKMSILRTAVTGRP